MSGPALELSGICKRFGAVPALDGVSLSIQPGEIFALVGENGAGKSTLMNVAYGLYRPDAGEIRIGGERVDLQSPADAIACGVGMVHQHFMLVPPLSVAENVVLGREPRKGPWLDLAAARRAVSAAAERLGLAFDPAARALDLSVGVQQRVEIVKALYRGAKVLILDEPTAVLTPSEAAELYPMARALKAQGHAVIFIGHKLREVLQVADRVGVMVRGRLTRVVRAAETHADELAAMMVGHAIAASLRRPAREAGEVRIALSGARCLNERGHEALRGVDLALRAGEILGVAGVAGNGQTELAEVLTGLRPLSAGALRIDGKMARANPAAFRARGVAHIPEDRQQRGLCLDLTVAENLALGRQGRPPFARHGFIDFRGREAAARQHIAELDIRPPDPRARARDLSGGNQQKIILARELDGSPRAVIAVQPTRGLDVKATGLVHRRLLAARDAGAAVLLVSLDLDEIRALSDRIAVIFEGRIVATVPAGDADEQALGMWMLGRSPAAGPPEAARA